MSSTEKLTATFVDKVSKPGRYGHGRGGHGLSLLVKDTSNGRKSKTFSQRITINGRPTNLGLGSYPTITLAVAQQRALENKQAVEMGKDPRHDDNVPTLREAAEAVIEERRPQWRNDKSEKQWRATLEKHALKQLGDKTVDKITAGEIELCLKKPWLEKNDTAQKVLQRLSLIMAWAVRKGYREHNPVSAARDGLMPSKPNKVKRHHKAVHHSRLPALLDRVRRSKAYPITTLCLDFVALTAARSGEAREATWGEIDFETRTWTVPAERMKAQVEHRVPLSEHAIEVLRRAEYIQLRALSLGNLPADALIFPSPRYKVLSDNTVGKMCRDLDLGFVPHGLRSTFRDWCAETGVQREVAEQALAHTVRGVEGDYLRTALLEQRRPVMEQWGELLRNTPSNTQSDADSDSSPEE